MPRQRNITPDEFVQMLYTGVGPTRKPPKAEAVYGDESKVEYYDGVPIKVKRDTMPPDLYDGAQDEQREALMPYVLGEELDKRIRHLALGRNVGPLAMLRQGLWVAFEIGAFDCSEAEEKRTGNDERPDHQDNQRLRAVLSDMNYNVLVAHAHARKVSNMAALRSGLKSALEKHAV